MTLPTKSAVKEVLDKIKRRLKRENTTVESELRRENDRLRKENDELNKEIEFGRGLVPVRLLGRGGFGDVYLCECVRFFELKGLHFRRLEQRTKVHYAVKRQIIGESEEWLLREAENHSRLRHPNIVQCYGWWIKSVSRLSTQNRSRFLTPMLCSFKWNTAPVTH